MNGPGLLAEPTVRLLALGANGLALALCAALLRAAWALWPDLRRALIFAGIGTVSVLAGFALCVPAASIPTEWLTPLQEGGTQTAIDHLYGHGAHAGPNFHAIVRVLGGPHGATMRDVVRMNLALGLINLLAFAVVATRIFASYRAGVLGALLLGATAPFVLGAVSGQSAQLLGLYVLMGVLAVAVWDKAPPERWGLRGAALGQVVVLTGLMGLSRVEMALIGLLILGTSALAWAAGGSSTARRLRAPLRVLGRPSLRTFFLAVLIITVLWLPPLLPAWLQGSAQLRFALAGLDLGSLAILTLPGALHSCGLPPSLVLLCCIGLAGALGTRERWIALAISVFVLFQVYVSAGHGVHYVYFEMLRYLTYLIVPVALLCLLGVRLGASMLNTLPEPGRWQGAAVLVLALGLIVGPASGESAEFPYRQDPGSRPSTLPYGDSPFLTRNRQVEIRYLHDLHERFGDCRLVSRVMQHGPFGDGPSLPQFHFFGQHRPSTQIDAAGTTLRDAVARYGPKGCVLYYRGLDANLVGADSAAYLDDIVDLSLIDKQRLGSLRYSDHDWEAVRPVVELSVFRVR